MLSFDYKKVPAFDKESNMMSILIADKNFTKNTVAGF